ncbi:MAG: AsnC family transcriptional regulator [Cypionkella sp.]
MAGPSLDQIDRTILHELQEDGRMTNVDLAKKAPQLASFFKSYGTTSDVTSKMLAEAREKGVTPEQQALVFLKTQGEVWKKWLPADVAGKVAASL